MHDSSFKMNSRFASIKIAYKTYLKYGTCQVDPATSNPFAARIYSIHKITRHPNIIVSHPFLELVVVATTIKASPPPPPHSPVGS